MHAYSSPKGLNHCQKRNLSRRVKCSAQYNIELLKFLMLICALISFDVRFDRSTLAVRKVLNWPGTWTTNQLQLGSVIRISMLSTIQRTSKPKSIACLNPYVRNCASTPVIVCCEHHVN